MKNAITLESAILLLKYLENGQIAVMDKYSTLRIIDPVSLKTVGGFKAKLHHEHRLLNIMDVSYGGKFTLIGVPKKHKAALFLTKEKKLKFTLGMHDGDIESVAISNDEQYIATGGTDGHTFVYHHATKAPMMALPTRSDYITCISFSEDSSIIAYGSYDRTITVKNISLMSDDFVLKGHHSAVKKLLFLSPQRMLASDKEGHLTVWDLHSRKVAYHLPKMLEEVLDITLTEDKRFLFASTMLGNIGLYDLEKKECIDPHYLKVTGRVNALCVAYKENTLFYASDDGSVTSHFLLEGEEDLKAAIERQDYVAAYARVKANILLEYSEHYLIMQDRWEKALHQAKQLYGKGLSDTAAHVLSPFAEVPGKRTLIKNINKEFEEFEKFKIYVSTQKYALAYSLSAQHPMYLETPEYEELEATWERQFARAKKSILAKSGEEQAREHLSLFRGVSHKAKQITALYDQRKVYMLFRAKLAKKDFTTIFQLVETYPFLADFKEYKEIRNWADLIYIKIHEAYLEQDYITAIKHAHHIKEFPEFKNEVSALIEHSQVFIDFKQALSVHDLDKIYQLLARNSFLADLPAIKGIDVVWDNILDKIDTPVSEGNMEAVLSLLSSYAYAEYKKQHIIIFVKATYMAQLEAHIEDNDDIQELVKGFQNFYKLFGKDDLLMIMTHHYSKVKNTKIDFSHIKPGTLMSFNLATLPLSIFEL
jgi:WD40 repeat protein